VHIAGRGAEIRGGAQVVEPEAHGGVGVRVERERLGRVGRDARGGEELGVRGAADVAGRHALSRATGQPAGLHADFGDGVAHGSHGCVGVHRCASPRMK